MKITPHHGRFARACIALLIAGLLATAGPAHAGADLDAVKRRGVLRCGVSEGIAGFSERNPSGAWAGLNVDFCRAVAVAVLGDPQKVEFVALKASSRFPALQSKTIDLLMRNTTWTMTREVLLRFQFPAILYYDGQGFMVRKAGGAKSLRELSGTAICVEKGTTHEARLPQYFALHAWSVTPVVIDSSKGVSEAFFAGRCAAYTSDGAQLAGVRARAPGGPQEFVILPERISKEPLGPVIRSGDAEFMSLVRWTVYLLLSAEENGITRSTVEAATRKLEATAVGRILSGKDERLAAALGVAPQWAMRVLQAVGNYGEMYERNVGAASPLAIERGYNALWTQGGLHYAPPFD